MKTMEKKLNNKIIEKHVREIILRRMEDDADWKRRDREYNKGSYRRME